ncbi:TPA: DnaD domain protein [Streptococcus suis]|uniref:DnaD domain protein n=1 Tax=Streptococcus suis TaxID=1307 RepID=UPI000943660A|nr:DnaD domain protein [Streptococcus suis]WNF58969.1 DnaD domain protein [Streptococcus suis]HEL1699403.1 DnaD domain protein [Streptococcus suis]HEL1764656.1 DnaD domain protein [Streptococcus suis]HEL1793041.1 DnaD domain protein [Streptococcus suis]HEL1827307.1 DnaD domain protein [Streptococcus suis]
MGNRRMISKTVTQTQRFLQMPLEAQALYFHLIQNSDDDGVVEAFPVVRMIGVSEDSLGLLIVKDFIRPLNEEMVYFITDFHEQNKVRADRKVNSVYIDLLKEVVPGIELTEPRQRTDRPKKTSENTGQPGDNQGTVEGQQNISQSKSSQYNLSQSRSSQKDEDQEIKNPIFEKLKGAFGEMSVNGTMIAEVEELLKIHGQSLLLYALEVTILNAGKSIRYTRTILANWQGQGLRTVEQVKQHEEKYRGKSKVNAVPFQELGRDEELGF